MGSVSVVLCAEGAGGVFLFADGVVVPEGEAFSAVSGGSGVAKDGDPSSTGEEAH